MEKNSIANFLKYFVMKMVLTITFQPLEHFNKMDLLREKNRVLKEIGRTMLCENSLLKYFWVEAVNTAYYVLNCILFRKFLNKTPYEL